MKDRKRLRSKLYTRKSRARYRRCIRNHEEEIVALETEKEMLINEVEFWRNAVLCECTDEVFIYPEVNPDSLQLTNHNLNSS